MKLIHYINFIFIIALLAFICIIEEVTVSNSLENIQNRCYKIEQMVDNTDGLKTQEIVLAMDNLEYVWLENESTLCYMVNHKNIQEIGQEIAKAKGYIAGDDVKEFKVCINTIVMYCHSYLHFMGASIHNVL